MMMRVGDHCVTYLITIHKFNNTSPLSVSVMMYISHNHPHTNENATMDFTHNDYHIHILQCNIQFINVIKAQGGSVSCSDI